MLFYIKRYLRNTAYQLIIICCILVLLSCQQAEIPGTSIPPSTDTSADTDTVSGIDANLNRYVFTGSKMIQYNGYLYFQSGLFENFDMDPEYGYPVRMNVKTNNITYICPDPLCGHDSVECPFAGNIINFYVEDNKIYYIRMVMDYAKDGQFNGLLTQYCNYDITTMKLKVLYEKQVTTMGINDTSVFHNGYWYFLEVIYDEEYQGTWGLHRINLKTGKMEVVLSDETSAASPMNQILFAIDDRLYFSDLKSIYSTNAEMEDKVVHVEGEFVTKQIYTNGEAVFYGAPAPNASQTLHRYELDTGKHTDLGIQTSTEWFLTEQYIYYMAPQLLYHEGQDPETAIPSGVSDAVWRCRHDGTEKEKVFDLYKYYPESENLQRNIRLYTPTVVGDTLYSLYDIWEDTNGDGKKSSGDKSYKGYGNPDECRIIKINLTDGSFEEIPIR